MARMTPGQEAAYALRWNTGREGLPEAAKTEYDRLVAERAKAQDSGQPLPSIPTGHVIPARSSPEVRARILQLIKQANPKYAKPFERNRMAGVSLVGTESWAEYGQVVLQMAILDTLLSIEELLMKANGPGDGGEDEELQDPGSE